MVSYLFVFFIPLNIGIIQELYKLPFVFATSFRVLVVAMLFIFLFLCIYGWLGLVKFFWLLSWFLVVFGRAGIEKGRKGKAEGEN